MQKPTSQSTFIIAAISPNPAKPPAFFGGWDQKAAPGTAVSRWSKNPADAIAFPIDEAITEAKLLAPSYGTRQVMPVARPNAKAGR